jgi:hypothetical protein
MVEGRKISYELQLTAEVPFSGMMLFHHFFLHIVIIIVDTCE